MTRVSSLVEQENVRLHRAMEVIFCEVVFNMLATSVDKAATLGWIQRRAEAIYCDKVYSDNENAMKGSAESVGSIT